MAIQEHDPLTGGLISSRRQSRASFSGALVDQDLEKSTARAHAVRIDVSQNEREAPQHRHRKGSSSWRYEEE